MSVPLVDPLIRQTVGADYYCGIYHRMYYHPDVDDRVASVRRQSLDGMQGVLTERMSEYRNRLSLDDMSLDVVVVRMVDCEV